MPELVYDISADGKVEGMHHDCFNLGFLGDQSIQRASDIRFDTVSQKWAIWLIAEGEEIPPTPALSGFTGYDEARRFEVQALNACRKLGVRAETIRGNLVIEMLRDQNRVPE